MSIVLLLEGKTERACVPVLKAFLDSVAEQEGKPRTRLASKDYSGSEVHDTEQVQRDVTRHLGTADVAGVVLLTDVCPRFRTAEGAKAHYQGIRPADRFRAHCALHDFEAWLLPYCDRIHQRLGKRPPKHARWPQPERVDLDKPPSKQLADLFQAAGRGYRKTVDAPEILKGQDLAVAAEACPELRAFLNSLLEFAGLQKRL